MDSLGSPGDNRWRNPVRLQDITADSGVALTDQTTRWLPATILSICFPHLTLFAAEPTHAEQLDFFTKQVEPILSEHCYECHGNGQAEGEFNLYTRDALLKGGESGPAVDLEAPSASILLEAINYSGYEMPPDGQLSPEKIAILTRWVTTGAVIPERTDVMEPPKGSPEINDETRNHWSFRPLVQPPVPTVAGANQPANPIDAFVLHRLRENGLNPNPPADRRSLFRRLHYDLLGLPPDPEEVEAFANDPDPQAYRKLVERLLKSPHYGEHWARYWLDLVRYAESNSFERDNPKPFVWKYRDYVIRSLNEDKPFDRFILEQLAGDELAEITADSIIATGYYRLGPWDDEPADPQLAMYDELDDIISTTSQALMGLTMNCARCHEHKLDPIPLEDYYRFLAFFRNVQRYGIRSEPTVLERSVRSIASPAEERRFQQELESYQAQVTTLRAELDAVESGIRKKLVGGEKDDFKADSVRLGIIRKYVGEHLTQQEFDQYAHTRETWTELRNHPPRSAEQALCVKEHGADPLPTHVLLRGNPKSESDLVQPGFPQVLSVPDPEIVPPAHGESSGRRLALAKWIASPDNPLTPRVFVNRIWQWHFGRGIVRSANNFGLQGDLPTHPQLLDWLASEFIARGWSLKEMHRLILLSDTYRMSSAPNSSALEADPQNNLIWRFDMRRLRAEEVRDSILAVNRTLNLETMHGPSIYPEIPPEVLAGQSRPGQNWPTSAHEESRRRSIYIHIKRSLTVPLLAAFDVAETDFSCPVRFVTTQPTQALGMLNSSFLNEQAETFADDVLRDAGTDHTAQVSLALRRVMQREPLDREIARGTALLTSLQEEHEQSPDQALKAFCLLAFNLNEFLYLD